MNTQARMVGRLGVFACGCCHKDTPKRERRQAKRSERNTLRKALDNPDNY